MKVGRGGVNLLLEEKLSDLEYRYCLVLIPINFNLWKSHLMIQHLVSVSVTCTLHLLSAEWVWKTGRNLSALIVYDERLEIVEQSVYLASCVCFWLINWWKTRKFTSMWPIFSVVVMLVWMKNVASVASQRDQSFPTLTKSGLSRLSKHRTQ